MKKYFIWSLGCQMNKSDAERLATKLEQLGYHPTMSEHDAHLLAVVACSVRQSAIDRIFGKARAWNAAKLQRPFFTLLTGCILPKDRPKMQKVFDVMFDINDLNDLGEKIRAKENVLENINPRSDYFKIPPKRSSSFQAWIPIMTGCNEYCTYCAVPFTRGKEVSRSAEDILAEVRHLIASGVKEITFLGQTIDAYENPNPFSPVHTLSDLLLATAAIPGDFWIRFLTSHPNYFSSDLIDAFNASPKICPSIHLPIQAGDNTILRLMNRKYTREHYLDVIREIQTKLPYAAVSTDIIVGFPGETEDQFQQTVEVMKAVKYDMAYLAQYSPRPGTAAQKIWKDAIPRVEKQRREKILNDLLTQQLTEKNASIVGTTHRVLVERKLSKARGSVGLGKTSSSKVVSFPWNDGVAIGSFVDVAITRAEAFGLFGDVVASSIRTTPSKFPTGSMSVTPPTNGGRPQKELRGQRASSGSR